MTRDEAIRRVEAATLRATTELPQCLFDAAADSKTVRRVLVESITRRAAELAEIERLRGDVRVARNELALERESYEQMHDVAIRHRRDSDRWAALAADATARAEKAEAERADVMRHVEKMMLRVEAAEARADRYLAAIREWIEAEAATDAAEEAYITFGSRMMDRSLPPVTEAEVIAAFMAVGTVRDRARSAESALRAIAEEEVRRG